MGFAKHCGISNSVSRHFVVNQLVALSRIEKIVSYAAVYFGELDRLYCQCVNRLSSKMDRVAFKSVVKQVMGNTDLKLNGITIRAGGSYLHCCGAPRHILLTNETVTYRLPIKSIFQHIYVLLLTGVLLFQ